MAHMASFEAAAEALELEQVLAEEADHTGLVAADSTADHIVAVADHMEVAEAAFQRLLGAENMQQVQVQVQLH